MGMFYVNNIFLKHLLLVLFLLLIGYISKESMEKYDKELIKETVLKVTLIVLGCVAFSLAFLILLNHRCKCFDNWFISHDISHS